MISLRTALVAIGTLLLANNALAGAPVVYSPKVTKGQTEFEFRGSNDHVGGEGNSQNYAFAVGHAFTSWWRPEIYVGRFEKEAGGETAFAGTEFENTFQLAPTGKYWADIGFLAAYEANPSSLESDKVEFGPLFEKQVGRSMHRLNLLWEKGVGPGSSDDYEFQTGYSYTYSYSTAFAPGIEFYATPDDNAYQAGPVISGEKIFAAAGSELEYSIGVLLPLSDNAPDTTLVFRLEYELF